MAKNQEKKKIGMETLLSTLKDKIGDSVSLGSETSTAVTEWLNSGNYMLNAVLSGSLFKGYGNTKSYCIAGESACLPKDETVEVYIFQTVNLPEEEYEGDIWKGLKKTKNFNIKTINIEK